MNCGNRFGPGQGLGNATQERVPRLRILEMGMVGDKSLENQTANHRP